jgi:hypothetical protein
VVKCLSGGMHGEWTEKDECGEKSGGAERAMGGSLVRYPLMAESAWLMALLRSWTIFPMEVRLSRSI